MTGYVLAVLAGAGFGVLLQLAEALGAGDGLMGNDLMGDGNSLSLPDIVGGAMDVGFYMVVFVVGYAIYRARSQGDN